jgi:hypothetical protein
MRAAGWDAESGQLRSKPATFEAHAEQCTWMAATVHDRRLKSLLLDLGLQWRELAATAQSLEADAKERKLSRIYVVNVTSSA